MNVADKPYAELMALVAKVERDYPSRVYRAKWALDILRAAMKLPPDRVAMMLAVLAVAPLITEEPWLDRHVRSACFERREKIRETLQAFVEEARWRAL